MGYPMTFSRFICRNGLSEFRRGYDAGLVHGDLLRFVQDTQDDQHVEFLSQITGSNTNQIKKILSVVFDETDRITVNHVPFGMGI